MYNIQAYIGYTDHNSTTVSGRVLDNDAVVNKLTDGWFRNFLNTVKLFNSKEIADQEVNLTIDDRQYSIKTDKDGYFRFDIKISLLDHPNDEIILEVKITNGACEPVKILKIDTQFIVVSDIDDTIIKTQVSSILKLKLLFNTIFRNQYQRSAVPGMSEVYRQLKREYKASFFYISKSPYNLYTYITDFLNYKQYPEGAVILRDFGWHLLSKKSSFGEKYDEINKLFLRFPKKKFILVGDSAEKDADIYADLATKYKLQTQGIFIRTIGHQSNINRIKSEIITNTHTPIVLFADSQQLEVELYKVMHDERSPNLE